MPRPFGPQPGPEVVHDRWAYPRLTITLTTSWS